MRKTLLWLLLAVSVIYSAAAILFVFADMFVLGLAAIMQSTVLFWMLTAVWIGGLLSLVLWRLRHGQWSERQGRYFWPVVYLVRMAALVSVVYALYILWTAFGM